MISFVNILRKDIKEINGYIIKNKIYIENTSNNPIQIGNMNILISVIPTTDVFGKRKALDMEHMNDDQ